MIRIYLTVFQLFFILFLFLLTIKSKLLVVQIEIKIVNKEATHNEIRYYLYNYTTCNS